MYEYQGLENFWKRYNRVLLDRVALDKEKSDLLHENQQLRTLLKQYLDGISVNDEILNQVNPLFVINHRTNVNIRSASAHYVVSSCRVRELAERGTDEDLGRNAVLKKYVLSFCLM